MAQEKEQIRMINNIAVAVSDGGLAKRLYGCTVRFTDENQKVYSSKWNPDRQAYVFDELPMVVGKVTVQKSGYDLQERKTLPYSKQVLKFYLGKIGSAYTLKDGCLLPFQANDGELGLVYEYGSKEAVVSFLKENGYDVAESFDKTRTILIRIRKKGNSNHALTLMRNDNILSAGPTFRSGNQFGFFSRSASLKFKSGTRQTEIDAYLNKYGFSIVKKQAIGGFDIQLKNTVSTSIVDVILEAGKEPIIERLNPSIVGFYSPAVD